MICYNLYLKIFELNTHIHESYGMYYNARLLAKC